MQARVHQVVTFASEPFRGNPAFVLSLPRAAPDAVLSAVTAELRESVLAALWPVEGGTVLRFFTPGGPHGGAGHATLAAAHVELARRVDGAVAFILADGTQRTGVTPRGGMGRAPGRTWRPAGRTAAAPRHA